MGAIQATSLLYKNGCDILIHMNADIDSSIPAYGRIQVFLDICREHQMEHELLLGNWGTNHKENIDKIQPVFEEIDQKYANKRKGIFLSNDTIANVFLNLLIRKYGTLPDDYRIISYDGSPVSSDAIIPFSTVGQQIEKIAYEAMELLVMQIEERKKRKPVPLDTPIHKVITPILIRRETTR